jgi:hypothetical protein
VVFEGDSSDHAYLGMHVEGSKIGAVIQSGRSYVDKATANEAVRLGCLVALLPPPWILGPLFFYTTML